MPLAHVAVAVHLFVQSPTWTSDEKGWCGSPTHSVNDNIMPSQACMQASRPNRMRRGSVCLAPVSASAITHHRICGPTRFGALALDQAEKSTMRNPGRPEPRLPTASQSRRRKPRDRVAWFQKALTGRCALLNGKPRPRPNSAGHKRRRSNSINCKG